MGRLLRHRPGSRAVLRPEKSRARKGLAETGGTDESDLQFAQEQRRGAGARGNHDAHGLAKKRIIRWSSLDYDGARNHGSGFANRSRMARASRRVRSRSSMNSRCASSTLRSTVIEGWAEPVDPRSVA